MGNSVLWMFPTVKAMLVTVLINTKCQLHIEWEMDKVVDQYQYINRLSVYFLVYCCHFWLLKCTSQLTLV